MSDREHLRQLWQDLCNRQGLNRTGASSVYTPADLKTEARQWLVRVFLEDPPEFSLPNDLNWWLEEVATTGWTDSPTDSWRSFVPGHQIVALSEDARWVDDPPECRTVYLALGSWSDRHHYLVNCSPDHPEFGSISDYNDTHPWMNSRATPEHFWPDMTAFLARDAE